MDRDRERRIRKFSKTNFKKFEDLINFYKNSFANDFNSPIPSREFISSTVHYSDLYETYVKGSLQFPSLTLFF